jgi:hypothetical protein
MAPRDKPDPSLILNEKRKRKPGASLIDNNNAESGASHPSKFKRLKNAFGSIGRRSASRSSSPPPTKPKQSTSKSSTVNKAPTTERSAQLSKTSTGGPRQSSPAPSVEEIEDLDAGGAPKNRPPRNTGRIIESEEEGDGDDGGEAAPVEKVGTTKKQLENELGEQVLMILWQKRTHHIT